jgi:hypothetical protein
MFGRKTICVPSLSLFHRHLNTLSANIPFLAPNIIKNLPVRFQAEYLLTWRLLSPNGASVSYNKQRPLSRTIIAYLFMSRYKGDAISVSLLGLPRHYCLSSAGRFQRTFKKRGARKNLQKLTPLTRTNEKHNC